MTLEVAMRYKIALLKTDEGYSVSVPGLPGCWSQGATEQEALENIQAAIQEYLTAIRDSLQGGRDQGSRGGSLILPKMPGVAHLRARSSINNPVHAVTMGCWKPCRSRPV